MKLTWDHIQTRAVAFSKKWQNAANEEAEAQSFTREFLSVFGVEDPLAEGAFERKVPLDDGHNGYIDYLWPGRLAIEMKSAGKSLADAYKQLANYVLHLPADEMPELLMVCDFRRVELHHRATGQSASFLTANLRRYVRHFAAVAGYESSRLPEEQISVNLRAAEKIARLHDALAASGYGGHELEVYLVRLVFCFFAEDTGIFPRGGFRDLVANSDKNGADLPGRLAFLFQFLNTPPEKRAAPELLPPWISPAFQYINGGLFADMLPMPLFSAAMRRAILDCCDFDWADISPAIFGAMFQGVLDARARRELGAHYTSEENILKVIRPLFLDELRAEFERAKADERRLAEFHGKIARLRFLDPACGCGNFLIVAYRELRALELDILKMRRSGQQLLDIRSALKVSVAQFSGLEIEDFPCQIARAGMWLTDHLMNLRVSDEFGQYVARLPLTAGADIRRCDALETDWNELVPKGEPAYIMGNPPFVGARMMGPEQKAALQAVFGGVRNAGNLDYVCCWHRKAADMMRGTTIRAALVSTNSVTQGEQAALLWRPLFADGIHIDFAHRTFRWDNEARGKAHVHCVIVGFSAGDKTRPRLIFDDSGAHEAANINAYLVDAPDVFVESRSKPLCEVPEIGIGNKPIDGGHYLFTAEEKDAFLALEPAAARWFRPWYGSQEFIARKPRFCLWLGDCPPQELKRMPHCLERVEAVRAFRLASKSPGTVKLAATPTRFHVENMPKGDFIVIPEVSSERRFYVPIGFMTPDNLCSNLVKLIPEATLFHFGVLTSSVHMAWMRAVCGRLEMRYRYSKDIVYNNFPWPEATEATESRRAAIEKSAQAILDARARFPEASLADLYDERTMPPDLRKAHQQNDRAALLAYGMRPDAPEPEIVAALMGRYREMTGE